MGNQIITRDSYVTWIERRARKRYSSRHSKISWMMLKKINVY